MSYRPLPPLHDRASGSDNRPLRNTNVNRRVWTKALQHANLPKIHFHDLRHTGNTLATSAGASTRELMARMGHSSTRAALIHQHSTDERQRDVARKLDELARGALDTSGTQRARPQNKAH
ncbi:tyrosine-type recombinase/integrase [Nonomuraea sp. NPDC048881]|uniref:tyrosine-type recombinase/integrase n=1 Tax=Nonomuraea sp. NPDC048881 TaxID=3155030 RepID=UPI0033F76EAC